MHVDKLRIADSNGLAPAGRYFKQIADALRDANSREGFTTSQEERQRWVGHRVRESVQ